MMSGHDLARARHELGLSVTELAERLKLDMPNGRTFVRDMESGRKPISGPVEAAVELMLKHRQGATNGRKLLYWCDSDGNLNCRHGVILYGQGCVQCERGE